MRDKNIPSQLLVAQPPIKITLHACTREKKQRKLFYLSLVIVYQHKITKSADLGI
jgi:hypothetical protein